ncbi:hydroxymethylglutaryl-CoA reductase, degradative [Corallococcus sp. CA053C]|uniref:hydroxymethylglutaryl-CoA reductase, degradative n=1 Tax=Corallococcus sp. CA053C TaxID=2316732 RepID=UPI001F2800DC|nr:hydroxymethylglutaryl-CoA reductase, degradative [Corallococcus sp. CA053C]
MSGVVDDGVSAVALDMPSSRLPGFHRRSVDARWRELAQRGDVSPEELRVLRALGAPSFDVVNQMIENAVGVFALPLGLGLNLTVNGRDHLVPMAVEEPSVVAAVSFAAKVVREAGGFTADADPSMMIGQVQLTRYGAPEVARERVLAGREQLLALANSFHPSLLRRGGGARDVQVRILPAPEGPQGEPLFIVHLLVDTQEAMGANLINTMAEGVAPLIEQLTGGRVFVRILSNLADQRLARASCRIPVDALADFDLPGEAIAEGILQASRFAEADPYRAATHNKGVMNGIDAVAIATGQDWRAIEAGAHAYACRLGRYGPLSRWTLEQGHLVGRIELPLALGMVGGATQVHPGARLGLKLLRVSDVRELAQVFASVGLAQNFAAVRALGSVGIQKGHMALHARCVAVTAGARGLDVERVAQLLVERGSVKVETARELLASFQEGPSP